MKIFVECACEAVCGADVCSKIQRRLNEFQLHYEKPPIATAHEVGAHVDGLRSYFLDDPPGNFDQRGLWHKADDVGAVFFLYAKVTPLGRLENSVTVVASKKEQRVFTFALNILDERLHGLLS